MNRGDVYKRTCVLVTPGCFTIAGNLVSEKCISTYVYTFINIRFSISSQIQVTDFNVSRHVLTFRLILIVLYVKLRQ